jgi:anti-sigma B factor antagonist
MANVQCTARQVISPGKKNAVILSVEGIINTETLPDFQAAIKTILDQNVTRLVLDLKSLTYINSTGLGELIRTQDTLKGRGGDMVLASVPQEVIRTIKIIGFHTFIKIFPGEAHALGYFDSGSTELVEKEYQRVAPKPAASGVARKPVPHKPRFPRTPVDASIMLVMPKKDVFADILAMRWGGDRPGGKFRHVPDRGAVLSSIATTKPDLMIIDNSVPDADSLCKEVKVNKASSMVGVIKVYGEQEGRRGPFYVAEDDRVTEPFEYKELFAVAESELRRAATRDKFAVHKMQFEFANIDQQIDQANDLIAHLVRQADLDEHDASEVRTAAREALDNAYRHGNICQPNRRIIVGYTLDHEKLTITVQDEGKGFDYNFYLSLGKETDPEQRARLRAREGKPGGLGIMLMMRCLTALEYDPPGNMCRLMKKPG